MGDEQELPPNFEETFLSICEDFIFTKTNDAVIYRGILNGKEHVLRCRLPRNWQNISCGQRNTRLPFNVTIECHTCGLKKEQESLEFDSNKFSDNIQTVEEKLLRAFFYFVWQHADAFGETRHDAKNRPDKCPICKRELCILFDQAD